MTTQITILIADNNSLMRQTLQLLISSMENTKLVGKLQTGKKQFC